MRAKIKLQKFLLKVSESVMRKFAPSKISRYTVYPYLSAMNAHVLHKPHPLALVLTGSQRALHTPATLRCLALIVKPNQTNMT